MNRTNRQRPKSPKKKTQQVVTRKQTRTSQNHASKRQMRQMAGWVVFFGAAFGRLQGNQKENRACAWPGELQPGVVSASVSHERLQGRRFVLTNPKKKKKKKQAVHFASHCQNPKCLHSWYVADIAKRAELNEYFDLCLCA